MQNFHEGFDSKNNESMNQLKQLIILAGKQIAQLRKIINSEYNIKQIQALEMEI